MAAYRQVMWLLVDEDVENGIAQVNQKLKKMALEESLTIVRVVPNGNAYFIEYQKTPSAVAQENVQNEGGELLEKQ